MGFTIFFQIQFCLVRIFRMSENILCTTINYAISWQLNRFLLIPPMLTEVLVGSVQMSRRSKIKMDEFRFIGASPWINLYHSICFTTFNYVLHGIEADLDVNINFSMSQCTLQSRRNQTSQIQFCEEFQIYHLCPNVPI